MLPASIYALMSGSGTLMSVNALKFFILEMAAVIVAPSPVPHSMQMLHLNRTGLRGQLPLGYDTLTVTQAGGMG